MQQTRRWAGLLALLAFGVFGQAGCTSSSGAGQVLVNLLLGVGTAVGGYYLVKALD